MVIALTSVVFGFAFGVSLILVVVIAAEMVIGLGVEVVVLRRVGGLGPRRRSGRSWAVEKGVGSGCIILVVVVGRLALSPPLPSALVLLGGAVAIFIPLEEAVLDLARYAFKNSQAGAPPVEGQGGRSE